MFLVKFGTKRYRKLKNNQQVSVTLPTTTNKEKSGIMEDFKKTVLNQLNKRVMINC